MLCTLLGFTFHPSLYSSGSFTPRWVYGNGFKQSLRRVHNGNADLKLPCSTAIDGLRLEPTLNYWSVFCYRSFVLTSSASIYALLRLFFSLRNHFSATGVSLFPPNAQTKETIPLGALLKHLCMRCTLSRYGIVIVLRFIGCGNPPRMVSEASSIPRSRQGSNRV